MDFFSLRTTINRNHSGQQFLAYICDHGSAVHNGAARADLRYAADGKAVNVLITGCPALEQDSELAIRRKVREDLIRGLALYIVEVKENSIATQLAARTYSFSSKEEERAVKDYFHKLLSGSEAGDLAARQRRMDEIRHILDRYLQDHDYLDLDGFIDFRLQNYKDKLREMVDVAMEEYLLDQQYEEFIHLLQYFVHFQEPLTPFVNLMHIRDHEFSFLNEDFTKINIPSPGGVVAKMVGQELEMEDRVVSTLISLSPDRILVHTVQPDAQIIVTIQRIFGDRVQLCLHCPQCHLVHQDARRRDQGS